MATLKLAWFPSYFLSHLDLNPTIELYACILQNDDAEAASDSVDGEGFQLQMMRCLREINVDNNMVGWYTSAVSGSYQVVENIKSYIDYIENLEHCICIVYDITAAHSGVPGVKAIRLTDSFVEAYRKGALTIESIRSKGLSWRDVFVEIPITIHNSPMAVALMAEIEGPTACTQLDFDRLSLGVTPVLEKNVQFINECLDELVHVQGNLGVYHNQLRRYQQSVAQWKLARRQENQARRAAGEEPLSEEPPADIKKTEEPSQLDNLLLSNQLNSYASHINASAAQAVEKLVLTQKLQQAL